MDDKIAAGLLLKYFPGLSAKQVEEFGRLKELYSSWNEKINVISRKDIEHLFLHHVLHSLSIAKIVSFVPGTQIIDVGTGGGFPGIPLAILFPESEFLLVDSVGKKITVVNEVANALGLSNVTAIKSRAEDVDTTCDFVVSRAVASINDLCNWTKHLIKPGGKNALRNGWLFLKGGDLKSEIREANREAMTFDISRFFDEDFFMTKQVVFIAE